MYRVLIVDDEEPVLDSYAFMLKGVEGFTLAGKARSGYEALQLINELQPDLVFMDINIPGMNGLDVIAAVHEKMPAAIFVLSTAYERFDLAQRAIPLGVFAYLVKPVSRRTFLATLEKARAQLEAASSDGREAEPAGTEPVRVFLWKTLKQKLEEDSWQRCREQFALPSDKGIICILETGDAETRIKKIADKLSFRHCCLAAHQLNRILFFISEDISREETEKQFREILKSTLPPELDAAYGIGSPRLYSEFHLSYAEALEDLRNKRSRGDLQIRDRLRIAQLRRRIGVAPPEEVRDLFSLLWRDIFNAGDFNLAKARMAAVFMFLLDDLSGCYRLQDAEGAGNLLAGGSFDPAEEIMPLKDPAAWETWAAAAFEILLKEAALRRSENFPLPLVKAMEYIRSHYAEAIQLGSAAEAAQVSPAYLSRLFSDHLGLNFIDYLTGLRIENAEKLLRTSRMNIKEVAYAVGYQDPNYFSKIFRKITGVLPSGYEAQRE